MRVVLFDIDGTLINTGGAGGAALRDAFCGEFGVAEAGEVALSGRTDRGIGRSLFQLHGLPDSAENWRRLRDAYVERLPHYMGRYAGRLLPGVGELLQALRERDGTAVGLLTGNVREGARIKLEHFGIHRHFAFGGFGDDHYQRDLVAREAIAAARQFLDGHFSSDQVWVIGDTPLDIRCARAVQARVLAVATGGHSRHELQAAAPDVLLDDLSNTDHVLEQLTN